MSDEGEQSFEALAVPQLDTVYRVARRLARDEHEAEDLVQETYLKAYKAFARFEVREFGIKPWLLKILHNTFLSRQARRKRDPKAIDQRALEQVSAASRPFERPKPRGHQPAMGGGPHAEQVSPPELDYENLDEEVKQAIDALHPEFRSVLALWATMELSYQEIANVLGVPIGTVMSRLHRARVYLARRLDEYAREHRITRDIGRQE